MLCKLVGPIVGSKLVPPKGGDPFPGVRIAAVRCGIAMEFGNADWRLYLTVMSHEKDHSRSPAAP